MKTLVHHRMGSTGALLASLLTAGAGCDSAGPADRPVTLREIYGLRPPARLDRARTALVLVDYQEEFFSGGLPIPDGRAALANAARLLAWARAERLVVAHVRQVSKPEARLFADDGPGVAFAREVEPAEGEIVVTKSTAGGFTRTDLDAKLRARGVETLVVSGLMTHLAVDSTVRDGLVLGYRVLMPGDASATRDLPGALGEGPLDHRALHAAALAALADRFADVLPTDAVIALRVEDRTE